MARKKKTKAEKYEAIPNGKGSNVFAALYASMLQHPKWIKLSDKQKNLYTYMKLQKYGGNNNRPDGAFNDTFYFNWGLASRTYQLYQKNKQGFYADIKALVDAGFIDRIENGRTTRTKSIYKYSDRWQKHNCGMNS